MSTYNLDRLLAQFAEKDLVHKHFKAEEVVFREGGKVSYIYFVAEGEVRVERYLSTGQSLVFFRATSGAALSEVELFVEKHPYTAIATVESRLVLVVKERLLDQLRRDQTFMEQFFFCMAWRYNEALMLRELSSIRSADERLLMWFEWQVNMGKREFPLEGRMGGLGADLGLTRESVYRSLARLEKRKFIERHKGVIRFVRQ